MQCLPTHGSTLAHAEYVENIEEWESMGRQTRSRTNEGLTGRAVEREERRARLHFHIAFFIQFQIRFQVKKLDVKSTNTLLLLLFMSLKENFIFLFVWF